MTKQVEFLRWELAREHKENEMFRVQDDINAAIFPGLSVNQNQPAGNEAESTMPLPATDRPLAKASQGHEGGSGNPSGSL